MFLDKNIGFKVTVLTIFIFLSSCDPKRERVEYGSLTIILPTEVKDEASLVSDIIELSKPVLYKGKSKSACEKYFFFPNESSLVCPNAKDTTQSKLITTLPESKFASFFGVNEVSLANRTEKHIHSLNVRDFFAQPLISDTADLKLINALKEGRNIFVYTPEYSANQNSFSIGGAEYVVFRDIESLKKKLTDTLCTFKLGKGAKVDFDVVVLYKPKYTTPETACQIPTGLKTSNLSSKNVVITWENVKGVSDYEFLYKPLNTDKWDLVKVKVASVTLNNLQAATNYEYKVGALCGPSQNSKRVVKYSAAQKFKTIAKPTSISKPPQKPKKPIHISHAVKPPPDPINSPSDLENYFNTIANSQTASESVGQLYREMKVYFGGKDVDVYYEGNKYDLLKFIKTIEQTSEKFNLWKYIDDNHSNVEIHLK